MELLEFLIRLQGTGDIVVKVGEHEFARVQRRQIIKAMAAKS